MEVTQSTPLPATPRRQQFSLGQGLAITWMTAWGLLVVGSLSWGLAVIAFRTDEIAPFDWRLALDEQHRLAIHYGPVCMPLPGIPAGACGDYVPDLNEFSISYDTPEANQQLVSMLVPLR